MNNLSDKIEAMHLKRKAILYIRQSTMRQVVVNTESTLRQYALKDRLIQLGWEDGMIEVIDRDLGRSGAETAGRDGFRQMFADVGEGNVGAIACIECSRLSRSSGDWGRLMEICALSGTILIDDDGIYDPNNFNDRLLLGLKGTMSEAELHFLRERMRGGALNKVKRGEFRCLLPVGYLYDEAGNVVKDPDIQMQNAIMLFFESFRICGSAHRLALYYSEKSYLFPSNKNRGFGTPDIAWDVLTPGRACKILQSPTYAGVYTYGKTKIKNTIQGKKVLRSVPEEQWISNIEDHHEAYITLDEYHTNLDILSSNQTNKGASPPGEGNALLQGTVLCSRCGGKMFVRYNTADHWHYICENRPKGTPYTGRCCLRVNGCGVDEAVSEAILRKLTPEAIKAADEVLCELEKRKNNENNYFVMQTEKAKYEVDLARKRYMNSDPDNRLVNAELERLWNEKMNRLAQAESELRKYRAASDSGHMKTDMKRLLTLPEELRKAWLDGALNMIDKKRIVRCLVEDIALNMSGREIQIGIRFKGGLTESLTIPRPLRIHEKITTDPEIIEYIREASTKLTAGEIADCLNNKNKKTGKGLVFSKTLVSGLQNRYNILPLTEYYQSIGYLSTKDKAAQLGIGVSTLGRYRSEGKLTGKFVKTSDSGDYMFES